MFFYNGLIPRNICSSRSDVVHHGIQYSMCTVYITIWEFHVVSMADHWLVNGLLTASLSGQTHGSASGSDYMGRSSQLRE